jgi:hypothetical protein
VIDSAASIVLLILLVLRGVNTYRFGDLQPTYRSALV